MKKYDYSNSNSQSPPLKERIFILNELHNRIKMTRNENQNKRNIIEAQYHKLG